MGDYLAAAAAKQARPPKGRVHLHLFIKRNGLHRVDITSPAGQKLGTALDFAVEWRVSTRGSSVCHVEGRCILADVVEEVS